MFSLNKILDIVLHVFQCNMQQKTVLSSDRHQTDDDEYAAHVATCFLGAENREISIKSNPPCRLIRIFHLTCNLILD